MAESPQADRRRFVSKNPDYVSEFDRIVSGTHDGAPVPSEERSRRRRRVSPWSVVAAVCIVTGLGVIAAALLYPQQVEQVYGQVKTNIEEKVAEQREQGFEKSVSDLVDENGELDVTELNDDDAARVREAAQTYYPSVSLGVVGGQGELDRCDGTFTIMSSYEREGVPATGASHNNCGGDVLLYWEDGQRVNLSGLGYDGLYEVVDIRHTSKIWSSTDDLVGLGGDIALQSCFYGVDEMKFVGLERVEGL